MRIDIILIVFVLFVISDAKRKKKKQTRVEKEKDPLDKRPSGVNKEHWCDSCIALLTEGAKELRGKKKESDVYDIMDTICDPEKYYTYHSPPPDMKEGCEAFVAGWNDEIIASLTNRKNDQEPIEKLCFDISKACVNVDPSNVPMLDPSIMVDGESVDVVKYLF